MYTKGSNMDNAFDIMPDLKKHTHKNKKLAPTICMYYNCKMLNIYSYVC